MDDTICPYCRQTLTGSAQGTICPHCRKDLCATIDSPATQPLVDDPYATVAAAGPASAASDPTFPAFPGYDILAELGRGGMGVVYQARQTGLKRLVALKMILSGDHAGAEQRARFRLEAEAVALLQHPNIVQIYEVGEQEGRPFFSLEYVDGGSLAQKLDGAPLPARDAAHLIAVLARTMHAAHERGIVHRDLKPANVLLMKDGTPKVTDFGLAKRLDSVGQTQTGEVMGTPSYMAPEQAAGRRQLVGPLSDVYALGAILYELLTGRPPFRGETTLDTLMHVLEREPAPPRLLNPRVERDLESICLKCLEKEPRNRYASAAALADDLHRFLGGESIQARSFNVLDRLTRALERSQLDAEFHSWGTMLLLFAGIIIFCHLALYIYYRTVPSRVGGFVLYTVQFLLMSLVFWRFRSRQLLPTTGAERQLWAIWGGYIFACGIIGVTSEHLLGQERLFRGYHYPYFAAVAGASFFAMGSSYWGRCYAFGVAFFALAGVMLLKLEWAILEYGGLWGICLTLIGLHLRRLGAARTDGVSEEPLSNQSRPGGDC